LSDILFSRVSYDLWTLDNLSEVNVISGDKLFTRCFIEDCPYEVRDCQSQRLNIQFRAHCTKQYFSTEFYD